MNSSPGWTTQGDWAFGHPTGGGGTVNPKPDPTSGASGVNVFGVNLTGDYSTAVGGPYYLTAGPLDFRGVTGATLRFQRWLNSDFQPYVTATLEVSPDGTTWTPVWANGGSEITADSWTQMQYDISTQADHQPTVYVRWGYQVGSDAYAYSGWNIDDVQFLGTTVITPQELWRQLHFGTYTNSGNAADDVDFEKDGLVNLVEWAFGLNPKNNSAGQLPQGQRIGENFVISFTRPAGVSGITYGAEWNTTLTTIPSGWIPIPDSDPSPDGYIFSIPIGSEPRKFTRLSVSNDP